MTRCVCVCVQLTAVDSVVFTLKAADADGDMISYIIDGSSVSWVLSHVSASCASL